MVFFVDSATNMNDERVFLVEQPVCVCVGRGDLLWKNHWESEMKLGIYVPINVDTLMSIGNDRQ